MVRTLWALIVVVVAVTGQVVGRQATRDAVFDVVSIRRVLKIERPIRVRQTPDGSLTLTGVPTRTLIQLAYPELETEIMGLPEWATSEFYDVLAKPATEAPTSTTGERLDMLRNLLANRYGMVHHLETHERPVFNLVLARSDERLGPSLVPSDLDCVAPVTIVSDGEKALCRSTMKGNRYEGETTLGAFARSLRGLVGRPVIDKSGLSGVYRISLESSTQPFTGATIPGELPSIFTALREQLGLKLESARAPLTVLVIDRIDRPTEN